MDDAKGTGMVVLRCASTAASTANQLFVRRGSRPVSSLPWLALSSACQATKRGEAMAAMRTGSTNTTTALVDLQR